MRRPAYIKKQRNGKYGENNKKRKYTEPKIIVEEDGTVIVKTNKKFFSKVEVEKMLTFTVKNLIKNIEKVLQKEENEEDENLQAVLELMDYLATNKAKHNSDNSDKENEKKQGNNTGKTKVVKVEIKSFDDIIDIVNKIARGEL